MKLKNIAMAAAVTLAAAVPTQAMAALERGDASLGFYGMFMNTGDMDTIVYGVSGGIFVTPHIEVSGDINTQYSYFEAGTTWSEDLTQSLSVGVDYYFLTNTAWLPFAGGGFSYSISTSDTNTSSTTTDYSSLMIEGGVRKPLAENADLDMRLRYISPTDDLYEDSTMFLVGVKVRF